MLPVTGYGDKPAPTKDAQPADDTETRKHEPPTVGEASSLDDDPSQTTGLSEDTVVAEYVGGQIRIKDLMEFVKYNPVSGDLIEIRPSDVPTLNHEYIRYLALWRSIVGRIMEDLEAGMDPDVMDQWDSDFQAARLEAFIVFFVQRDIINYILNYGDRQISEYYEANRDKYWQPFKFYMRHLLLRTYHPYTVSAEDIEVNGFGDLERIAEKVSGDKTLASNIRIDAPKGHPPPRYEKGKLWRRLYPGEKLLIPMNDEQADPVRMRLENIISRVNKERTFEELCNRYSDSLAGGDTIGPLIPEKVPVLDILVEEAEKTPIGELSGIFRTKHGYQVIEIVDCKEEGFKQLEKIRGKIIKDMQHDDRARLNEEFLESLIDDPDLEIEYDLLAQPDGLEDDTVIASLLGEEFLWRDLENFWLRSERPKDREGIRKGLSEWYPLKMSLVRKLGEEQMLDPDSELSRMMPVNRTFAFSAIYIKTLVEEQVTDYITPEIQQEYYDRIKHTEPRFKTKLKLAYKSIIAWLSLEDERLFKEEREQALQTLKKKLEKDMANIKTADDFLRMAPSLNAPYVALGHRIPEQDTSFSEDYIHQDYLDLLAQLEPGEFSPATICDNRVATSVLLLERIPSGLLTLEDQGVLDEVNKRLRAEQREVFEKDLFADYARRVKFKFLLEEKG
jgi:hypothetical protein